MALNYDNITAICQAKYIPKMADNIFNSSLLLKKMRARPDVLTGGTKIIEPLLYAKGRAGWYSEWDLLDVSPKETRTAAEFEWKDVYANMTISKQQENKVTGDEAVLNLIQTESTIAEKSIIDQVSTALFSDGTDTTTAHGLRHIIGYDRTLGGIDSSIYTWWDANVAVDINSNYSTTNLTAGNLADPTSDYYLPKVMRKAWIKCIHGGEMPDLVVVSDGLYDLYEQVSEGKQDFPLTASVKYAADLGFEVLNFKGRPVIYDEYCPGSYMFFINTNYFLLRIRSTDNFTMGEWQKPANQQTRMAQITCELQFTTNNSRYHGKIQVASAVD